MANDEGRSAGSGTFSLRATAETTTTGAASALALSAARSASSAATRRPTRWGEGARCDS